MLQLIRTANTAVNKARRLADEYKRAKGSGRETAVRRKLNASVETAVKAAAAALSAADQVADSAPTGNDIAIAVAGATGRLVAVIDRAKNATTAFANHRPQNPAAPDYDGAAKMTEFYNSWCDADTAGDNAVELALNWGQLNRLTERLKVV